MLIEDRLEERIIKIRKDLRTQDCPVCFFQMGDMPGSRDAYCPNCGYKDPCCE